MPFKSKKQWGYFFAAASQKQKSGVGKGKRDTGITMEMAKRWAKETPVPFKKLPERVRRAKARALKRVLLGKKK